LIVADLRFNSKFIEYKKTAQEEHLLLRLERYEAATTMVEDSYSKFAREPALERARLAEAMKLVTRELEQLS